MKAFLLVGLLSQAALATTLLKVDLGQLTRSSDAVVIGRVQSVQSRFSSDGLKILTDAEISVTQTLKGQVAQAVVVMQPGGAVGDVGQHVAGVARFTPGEEVAVFLEKRGSRYFVTGLGQGKYRLERWSDGKTYAVPADLDADLVDPLTRQPVAQDKAPILLETFVQKVVTAAGQTAPSPGSSPKNLGTRP